MTLSVGIGARQPECVSDEWRWSYVLIFNETSTKGQAHSKPPAWVAIDPPSALLQRCSLTTASTTAAVRESESSWLWNPQMWGWHWFCSADLSCCFFFFFCRERKKEKRKNIAENLVLYQHCGQLRERDGKRGWLSGSGWIETRWDTGTADGQIFSAQSLHHVAGGSLGDEHLLLYLTWPTVVPYIFCCTERM